MTIIKERQQETTSQALGVGEGNWGKGEGRKGLEIIKIYYMQVPIPQDKHHHSMLQTYVNDIFL